MKGDWTHPPPPPCYCSTATWSLVSVVTRRSIFFPVGLAVSLSVRFPHHRISLTAAITTRCRIAISFCSGQVQLGLIRVGGGREQVEGRRRRCNNIRCRKLKAQPPINTVAHVRLNSGPFNSARLQPIRRVNSIRHNSCRYNIDHGYFHTSVNTTHGPPPRLPTPAHRRPYAQRRPLEAPPLRWRERRWGLMHSAAD